ncbi:MAG: Dihydroneopterin monophosphate aldolase [Methanonatronarchaeales archaeon]|nr:Dihydroneopterin monophosphate aldolase [Methanonatronarchaeales archaeon]
MTVGRIRKTVQFDAAHRLILHEGDCRNLHGHRWKLEVRITGRIDPDDGMVEDFGVVNDVAEELDHAVILNEEDPLVDTLGETPDVSKPVTMPGDPTSENIIDHVWARLEKRLRGTASLRRMRLYETPGSFAERVAK